MLILQTIRASTEADHIARSGEWERGIRVDRTPDPRDTIVGIIGMGRIGKVVIILPGRGCGILTMIPHNVARTN